MTLANRIVLKVLAAIALLSAMACTSTSPTTPNLLPTTATPEGGVVTAYENARVFDGRRFETRTLYMQADHFIRPPANSISVKTVDLEGAFVTPPFAEAHNHVTPPSTFLSTRFLTDGIFYVMNPTTVVAPFEGSEPFFERQDTYDVLVSMGGVTAPGGHPEKLYVEFLGPQFYNNRSREDFEGDAFHYVSKEEDIDPVLDLLQEQGAQFVKTYLLYSEEFEKRDGDEAYYGATGLNPALFPKLVDAAHARGLRVAVHVETDFDALTAATAGVEFLAHLPGYNPSKDQEMIDLGRLSEGTISALKDNQVVVIPTYIISAARYDRLERNSPSLALRPEHEAMQRDNLKRLLAAGVPIAVGTDGFGKATQEAENYVRLGAMSRTQALSLLTNTGNHIFPDRALGKLLPGYEASFIAFKADPTAAPLGDAKPYIHVKQGKTLGPFRPDLLQPRK
ncbi:MAG: amidohydrolase family protein [Pseudomonadota bacterium]